MKVLLVAGASGGHIFPAQALGEALRLQGVRTLLVIPRKNSVQPSALGDLPVAFISVESVSGSASLKTLYSLGCFLKGFWESARILAEFSPDVVVGFGSIASIPAVLCAWVFRIRTVLHEQNVMPGKANRFLARFSDRICVSFKGSGDYFSCASHKVAVTGNPLRTRLVRIPRNDAYAFFSLPHKPCTVLVMGGSQGSARVNRFWMQALAAIPQPENVQVIHLCGKNEAEPLLKEYAGLGIEARVFTFLVEMENAFSCADLAVCRAGATTIAELLSYQVPAIILPYPHAGAHQVQNAKELQEKGAAVVIEDKELDAGTLAPVLKGLLSEGRLRQMQGAYGKTQQGSALEALINAVKDQGSSHG